DLFATIRPRPALAIGFLAKFPLLPSGPLISARCFLCRLSHKAVFVLSECDHIRKTQVTFSTLLWHVCLLCCCWCVNLPGSKRPYFVAISQGQIINLRIIGKRRHSNTDEGREDIPRRSGEHQWRRQICTRPWHW